MILVATRGDPRAADAQGFTISRKLLTIRGARVWSLKLKHPGHAEPSNPLRRARRRQDSAMSILRCADFRSAMDSLAYVFSVPATELASALPAAVNASVHDPSDPIAALPTATATELGSAMRPLTKIHYFHGTRARELAVFIARGLVAMQHVLDAIWDELGELIPEVERPDLRRLRDDLGAGMIGPHTYGLRVTRPFLHGPCGHLVCDALLYPSEYSSVDYFAGAEIVVDICHAVSERFEIDAAARYRAATRPCIVEFAMAATDTNGAIASALWYVDAAIRGERTTNANWGYDGAGAAIPPSAIVSVTAVERPDPS